MTLRSQILALIAVPFIALAGVGGLKVFADWDRVQSAAVTQVETQESVALMRVVHYLQVERGLSAVYLTSDGISAAGELKDIRGKTNEAVANVPDTAADVLRHLDPLADMRNSITDVKVQPGRMAQFYADTIEGILNDVSDQLLHQNNAKLAQLGAGLTSLAFGKEAAGQQRAAGATGFGQGSFDLKTYKKVAETGAIEAQLLDNAILAFKGILPGLNVRQGLVGSQLPEYRAAILETAPNSSAPPIPPRSWFTTITAWITTLHDVETTVADAMVEIALADAASARQALIITATAVIVSLIVSAAIGLRLITVFTRQFSGLQADLDRLARKEFDFEPAHLEAKTEVGHLSQAMEVTRAALQASEEKIASIEANRIADRGAVVGKLDDHLSRLSSRDLDCTIEEAFPEEYEQLRHSFNTTVTTLKQTIEQVILAAGSIHNGATDISSASDNLSNRTESQAATLEETAAALEQLTASVKSSADGARDVEMTMQETRQEAETSGDVVRNAVTAMNEIEQSSAQISQIISVIDDIAFQTNLLALNAGVEAARAGEAGKGFAVVASEVRALAQRSADAATEIKALISDSSKHVKQGVDLVAETGEALTSIVSRVNNISELVSSITKGATEQSTGLSEINTGVSQLDRVTQQNAAMVEEATAAGHMLHTDAGKLTDLMAQFKIAGLAVSAARNAPEAASSANPSAHGGEIEFGTTVSMTPVPMPAKVANAS